jgi:TetR/AcrR family transcriptional regulator, mexCD-oprJ operon repressor
VTMRSGSLLVAAEKALPAATVRQAHAGGLEVRVRGFIARAQAAGAFRSDLSADWLMATFAAVIHAAANEIDAGRLDVDQASNTITSTMLAVMLPPRARSGTPTTTSSAVPRTNIPRNSAAGRRLA